MIYCLQSCSVIAGIPLDFTGIGCLREMIGEDYERG